MGPYFIIHTAYSYLCISVGLIFWPIFRSKTRGFFSSQSILIIAGVLLSFGFNAAVTFQLIKAQFHATVVIMSLSFLFFYLAIFKYEFLSIVPVALQTIVDHISDSFMVFDRNEHLIDYNKTFLDTFSSEGAIYRRISIDELIDQVHSNLFLSELLLRFKAVVKQQSRATVDECLILHGEPRYFSIEVTPLFNEGRFLCTIVLLKDITEIHEAHESLRRNHEMLMEKERLASLGQLIGGIAHNLKTPIMSISGGIEAVQDLVREYQDSIGDPSVTPADHQAIAREMLDWLDKIRPHCSYMSDIITTVKGQAVQFNVDEDQTFTLDELLHRVDLLMNHELKRIICVLNNPLSDRQSDRTERRSEQSGSDLRQSDHQRHPGL
jgi:PAS domain-containing protein